MKGIYHTNVRFPAEMKEPMQRAANQEFRSINSLIIAAVNHYLTDPNIPRRGSVDGELTEE